MKRIALLGTITVLLLAGLATTAQAGPPPIDVWPNVGQVGTATDVQVWGMTPHSDFEVYGETVGGTFLGSGISDEYGYGYVEIVIPWTAAEGAYAIEVCEVSYVACTDTWSDFWVGRSAIFTVEPPPPTTTGIPEIRLEPATGAAGTVVTVYVSGFTPGADVEAHGGDYGAGTMTGGPPSLNSIGEAVFTAQIPPGAAAGTFTVAVCEVTYVDCADTINDFWVGASAGFAVVAPPPPPTIEAPATTTTTVPATTTTTVPVTTTTTVAATTTAAATPEVIPTPQPPLAGEGSVAFPAFEDTSQESGSGLWWLILIGLGAGVIGLLVGRRLQQQD